MNSPHTPLVFRNHPVRLFFAFLGKLPLLMLPFFLGHKLQLPLEGTVALCAFCALLIAFWVFGFRNHTVELTDKTVRARRLGKTTWEVPRDSRFSSHVTTHYHNGIPAGKTRRIDIVAQGGLQQRVVALNQKPFDLLMAHLQAPRPHEALNAPASAGFHESVAPFRVPRRAQLRSYNILFGVLMGLSILLCLPVVLLMFRGEGIRPEAFWLSGGVILGMNVLLAGILFALLRRLRNTTPETITLSGDSIAFDDTRFHFSEIARITATPPGYGGKRLMTVTTTGGQRRLYRFGASVAGRGFQSFARYDELCGRLRNAFAHDPSRFVMSL